MIRYTVVLLVCLTTQAGAQCREKYGSAVEDAELSDSLAFVLINEYRKLIDNNYDTLIQFGSSPKKFCKVSPFCKGVDTVKVNLYVKDTLINKIVTFTSNADGKFQTQFYFWKGAIIYAFQSFEYFSGKAPKGQWLNQYGMPGWEAEVYVCDWAFTKVDVKGVNEKRKLLRSEFYRKRPWSFEGSNTNLIVYDLMEFHCIWMIRDYVDPKERSEGMK